MEKETDELLYNSTDCLRKEYKDFVSLKRSFEHLEIYIKNRIEQISQYDNTPHQPKDAESAKNIAERVYIDDVRVRLGRAQQYLKQVGEERDNFPAQPELPPTQPLIKISGILEEISFKKVIGYFAYTEYSTEKQRAEEKLKRDNSGAVLVAVLSAFANSTAPNLLKDGKKKEYQCLYVKGKIGGKSFSGWLNKTDIKVGDYLEMAVMPDGDEYKMYAVANPEQQTISTTPGCSTGSRWFTVKSLIKMSTIPSAVLILLPSSFASPTLEQWVHIFFFYFLVAGSFFIYTYRSLINEYRAPGDLFERICATLNIPNGKGLALAIYTGNFIKEKKRKGIWIESDNEKMPQQKSQADSNFYFYPSNKNPD
ncbi:putative type VI secretion system effector [Serratia sp. DD3]|uniref:putative type VI secretion system effector n=1 Tax=Serratia sp. DD3 TaxID=1410619 RepID=UPI0004D41E76|nr:putative type VI secretion system effector [Serratia sp. DD3]KEY59309.1 hypothetical protein SRDD_15890 [Serratia sp. DD3]